MRILNIFMLSSLLLLGGCVTFGDAQQSKLMVAGQVNSLPDGKTYTNPVLGMTAKFPEGWMILTGQEFAERTKGTVPATILEKGERAECNKDALVCGLQMPVAKEGLKYAVIITIPDIPGDLNGIRDHLIKSLKQDEKERSSIDTLDDITVNGQLYAHFHINTNILGHIVVRDVYLTRNNQRLIMLKFSSAIDFVNENQEILKNIYFHKDQEELV